MSITGYKCDRCGKPMNRGDHNSRRITYVVCGNILSWPNGLHIDLCRSCTTEVIGWDRDGLLFRTADKK